MAQRGQIEFTADGGALTRNGARFLNDLGVNLDRAATNAGDQESGRMFCRPCLDWSERRPHIAGAVGRALCQCCFEKGWIRRSEEHTSELQSLMRRSSAVFCLTKKKIYSHYKLLY